MPDIELSWQRAAIIACCLAVVGITLRLTRRPRLAGVQLFTQEAALVVGLFALWQFAASFSVMGPGGALARGRWIWHLERAAHLPSETSVQRLFLPHPLLVQAFNLYYDVLHFPILIACLIWLFVWHRARYFRLRTAPAACTGACLLIQLIPVAAALARGGLPGGDHAGGGGNGRPLLAGRDPGGGGSRRRAARPGRGDKTAGNASGFAATPVPRGVGSSP